MTFKIEVDISEGMRAVKAINRMPKALTKELSKEVRDSAKAVAAETRKLLRGSGRGSKRGRRGTSAPGQPPARQTGALARSIRFRRGGRSGLSYLVEAREFYGKFLETGPQPRPFLTLAQENLSEVTAADIISGIEDVLRDAARS